MSLTNDILSLDDAIKTDEARLREIGETLGANKRHRAALVAILTPDEIAELNPVIFEVDRIGETPTEPAVSAAESAPVVLEV